MDGCPVYKLQTEFWTGEIRFTIYKLDRFTNL